MLTKYYVLLYYYYAVHSYYYVRFMKIIDVANIIMLDHSRQAIGSKLILCRLAPCMTICASNCKTEGSLDTGPG